MLTYKLNSDTANVIDTQISTETTVIEANCIQKTSYYNTPDIIAYAKRKINPTKVMFSSSAVTGDAYCLHFTLTNKRLTNNQSNKEIN